MAKLQYITYFTIGVFVVSINLFAKQENIKPIELTNPNEIQDATSMSQSIGKLSTRVKECIEKKLVLPKKCFCEYPLELSEAKKTYKKILKKHPKWRSKSVSYRKGNPSVTISFKGLENQFKQKCH